MTKFLPASILLFLLCILHPALSLQGQNLFPNPDFEQLSGCPTSYNQWSLLQDWVAGSASTPDYYNCSYYGVSVQASPSTGNGVLGLWGGAQHPSCPTSAYTENITSALTQPMISGHTYELSFDLQIDGQGFGSGSPNDCIRFGVYFYDAAHAPVLTGICSPTIEPHAYVMGSQVAMGQYQRFTFTLTPPENWDHVLIGTFATTTSGGASCAIYGANKLYFNLDNLGLSESMLLPANLLSFTGTVLESGIALEWYLLGGEDYQGIWIERCQSGDCGPTGTYEAIQYIPIVSGQDEYQYLDPKTVEGFQYYRLRIVGKGQADIYSDIRSFFIQPTGPDLKLFPNPAVDQVCLLLTLAQGEIVSLGIQDLQGRTIWQERRVLSSGPNLIKIPADNFAAGAYLLDLCTDSGRVNVRKRFLKS